MTCRLQRLRQRAGLSQRGLGQAAGVAQPLISRFEDGTTPKGLVAAYKLAAALGCAVTDIWPELPQRLPKHPRRKAADAVAARRKPTRDLQGKPKTGGK